ncbi:hypothetical protein [Demequina sp. NBRC 110052]|uniref:hypothetical protein n=1 Tax=Demequina sp. NBRC 110052 TaxID=1570341 RepID=UPI00117D6313|nr:hypothetical protein [Demequina sp. NBRC 110052]
MNTVQVSSAGHGNSRSSGETTTKDSAVPDITDSPQTPRRKRFRGPTQTLTTTAVLTMLLSGCVFAIDPAHPTATFVNDTAESLTFTIEYDGETREAVLLVVSPYSEQFTSIDDCIGDRIRVESEDGKVVGTTDGPACAGWQLTVSEDGTLTYEDKS